HLITRVFQYSEESEHILHVCRFEKFEPAPFLERNFSIRQLDLQIRRHVSRAEKNGHLAQRSPFLVKLENSVDDESSLRIFIMRCHEPRQLSAFSLCPEVLCE